MKNDSNNPMKIFFSYGHDQHAKVVKDIKKELECISGNTIKVWFDKHDLAEARGASWREKITQGILESHGAVGFLSAYSEREKGVCLDELAITVGSKNGMLHTVLLEDERKTRPSALVSERQWLDMSDYPEHIDDYQEYITQKATELYKILTSDEVTAYRREMEFLRKKLFQAGDGVSTRFTYCLTKQMTGRLWLLDKIEELRRQPLNDKNRIVMLYGGPGSGKTMFSAHFQHYNPYIAAAFACDSQSNENSDVDSIILNLAYKIAMRIPEYRVCLSYYLADDNFRMGSGKDRFNRLIASPLGNMNVNGNHETMYILIDALDEANGDALAKFIVEYAPIMKDWVRFLITARKESGITERFGRFESIDFDQNKNANTEDVRTYYTENIPDTKNKEKLIDRLLNTNGGDNFYYAELVCKEITADAEAGIDIAGKDYPLPDGMAELFTKTLDRHIGSAERFKEFFRKPLGMLLAAPTPLPLKLLQKMMCWEDEELNDFIEPFSTLLRIADETVTVYHRSFAEWLDKTKTGYKCSKKTGTKNLALGLWSLYQNAKKRNKEPDDYILLYTARLLLTAAEYDEDVKDIFEEATGQSDLLVDMFNRSTKLNEQNRHILLDLYYNELIFVYSYLAKDNPARYNGDLANSYNNAGAFYYNQCKPGKAEEYYLKAIAIYEKISKDNPDKYNGDIANSYNNAGLFYADQGKPEKAEEYYLKAIAIYEKLAKDNPDSYNGDLARSYSNAGVFYKNQGNPEKAEEYYLKAIAIREKLAEDNPARYNGVLAGSYNNAGNFYSNQGKPGKAEEYYLKAIAIREKLAEDNPDRYNGDLATSYYNYAIFSKDDSYFDKALSIAEKYPDNPYCKMIIDRLK